MKLTKRSWLSFLQLLFPQWQTRRSRKRRQLRRVSLQSLEPRQFLTGTLQVWNGSTQYTSGGNDSFGTVNVGASDNQTWLLKNVGSSTLTVNSDSLPTGFSTSNSTPISIQPSQYATFTVTLNTNSMGSYGGQVQLFTTDSNNNPFVLNVSGTVQQSSGGGTIELFDGSTQISNGGSDSFGTVTVGSQDTKQLTIDNVGSSSLTVSSVSLPSGYSTSTSLPITVPPNQTATLSVSLSTSTAGTYSGQMLVQSSDTSHNPFTVNLSGTVQSSSSPSISLKDGSTTLSNGGSDSFGTVSQGSSDTRTYTVTNQGGNTLSVSAISLPSGYSLQTSLPLNIGPGNSSTFVVSMSTTAVGTFSGTMSVTSNSAQNNPFNVSLSGTVTAPAAPVMSLADGSTTISNGGSDSFGSVSQGSSDNKTLTVKNTGNASLSVSAISLPSGYSLQTALPLNVAANSSTTFVVSMSTATLGTFSGTMSITDTDTNNNPYTVSLSGTVTAPAVPVMSLADGATAISNGGSDSFGSVTQGTSDTRTYTVNNTGNASLTVSGVQPPTGYSLQTAMPLTIAAGTSQTFIVSLNTSTPGTYTGSMVITDSDSANDPYTVSLSGTVTSPPPVGTVNIQANMPTASEPGNMPGQFTVTRTGSTSSPLTVNYTVGGTATAGVDYTALSGTVTIAPNMTNATITVTPLTGGDVNEVQQIVLPAPTGGTYTLSINSDTTAALAYNAGASAVAAALESLPEVGLGRVTVTGSGTAASPFVVTFVGALGGANLPQITGDGAQLTGGTSNTITTSVTTAGDDGGTVVAALSNSSNYTIGTPSQDMVTVIGEEPPVITVQATQPLADEVSGTAGTFTFYRNGPTGSSLTVYYTLGGSALDGVDFAWVPGSVTFAAGQSTAQVTIAPFDNGLPTPSKTVLLSLTTAPGGGPPPYSLGEDTTSGTVTITNTNLPVVTVFATNPIANEESTAGLLGGAGQFTVTRDGNLTNPLTVSYTVGGTAVAGSQYQSLSGSVTIPAGQRYAIINVTPIDDGGAGTHTSSTVVLSLANSSSYQIGSATSDTVTIDDDDLPQVSVAASTPMAVESTATPGEFTISIDSPQSSNLTIPYTVSGSAVSGTDFQPLAGSATIPAGQTSVVVSVVPLTNPAEVGLTTVQVTLGTAAGYELTVLKSATVSIVGDMTAPALTLAATTPVADEIAGTNGVFTVTRTGSTANALTAYYTIAGTAVDGTDYNLLPGSVTISAGQSSTTILITPMSDPAMQDSSRSVTLSLTNYGGPSGASYSIGNPASDTVTIDDLPTVSVQATTATAEEHELTPGVFTVTRANDPLQATQALTVNYTLTGTAVNGTDYQNLSGSVTIPAGQASTTINVTPIDADVVGGSQTVALSLASGGYLVGTAASDTVTINDDDLPIVGIQATTPTASELGGMPGVFTVTRNGPTTDPLTVSYSVSGTGVPGTNYQPLSGNVTIPAGSATATINVTPIDIGMVGGSFSVVATLSASSAYWLTAVGPTPAPQTSDTVTIDEDDLPTVMIEATQAHATESGTTGTFTVSRNGTTTNPLTVLYTIAGTAANGTDYQTLVGNVTIPANQSYTTITVTPINDPAVEQDQTVVLTLAATSQYVAGSEYTGSVTIFDDNPPSVTVAATANAVEQPAAAGTFTVTRVGPTDSSLDVQYTVSGTAASGTDYSALPGTVTIPAGQSSATIDVTPLVDSGPETQQIVIPAATGGTYTLSLTSETDSLTGPVETTVTTAPLAYNASASAVQAALALFPQIGQGNISVSGQGTTASPFVVQFLGGLVGVEVPQLTGDASQLTGTTGVNVTTTTAGQRGFSQVEQVGYTATSNITGGTFTLTYLGNTTAALAYNASAATVQSAVQALPQIGAGNVAVTTLSTGPDTYTWQITFQGSLADAEVGQVTTNPGSITVSSGSASADDSIITYGSSQGGIDAVQQVTVNGAVGGTFTLTYQGATTAAIAYNATATDVQNALRALSTIGQNNVAVTGNAGGPWSITFQASLGDEAVPALTADPSALVGTSIATSISAYADGQRTVVVTLASSSTYTIGTLATPTASGGTGASDTVTITDPGNNLAPTVVSGDWTTQIGQALSVSAPGALMGAADPGNATLTPVILTNASNGTLLLNSDGSFTYTPNAGFQGTDSFVFQAFDGTTYSAPATVTINVVSAPAPAISITDASGASVANGSGSIGFGSTWVGTAVTEEITITNTGTADLTLSSWTAPAGFTIVTAPAADVAAGSSTIMTVQMDATTAGSYDGTFSLDDNVAGASPFTFTLSGTVNSLSPVLEVLQGTTALANGSPSGFSFGTTGQGEPLTDTFVVENTGTANLVLSDPINLPAGFTLAQVFGATTLAPGASTTFAVELAATATGSYSGNLSFGSNDSNNSTYSLPLTGSVVASPVVEVLDGSTTITNGASSAVDFGTALVGTALEQTFTIDNNGTINLDLTPAQLTLPAGFSVVTPYATSVAPGNSTTLVLQIDGSTAGTFSGTVSFPTNDVDNATFSFPVSGEIDTPKPQIEVLQGTTEVAPGSGTIDFGSTPVGTPMDVTLAVENVGTADLTIDQNMRLPSGFRLVSLGSTTVAPGASTSMVLEMIGAFAGTYSGAASTNTNDPVNDPVTFNLAGTASAPQAQVTQGTTAIANQTGSVDFGQTDLGTPVVETFSITNAGSANLVLTDPIYVPYGFSLASDFGSTTLAPGASTTFSVQLDADTAGEYQGAIALETNDPNQALFTFNVTGEVGMPIIQVSQGSNTLANGTGTVDFGSTVVGTPVSETINVTNAGTGMLTLTDPISLPTGFSLVSDFGNTSLAPGASTSFTVELTATAAGFDNGNVSFGTNSTLLSTFGFGVSGGVAVPRLDVLEGTTDVTNTANPLDFGTTVVGTPRDEVLTVKNTGTTNLVLSDPISLPAGFTLVSDFGATTLAPGASTTFTVALSAATAGDLSGSISFGTNLSNVPTFTLPVQGEVIGLSNFRLWDDTGYSSTDGHTSDPTVAGNLIGVLDGSSAEVQFQVNNDGNVDGSVTADSTMPFTFTPVGLTPGAVTIDARVHLVDAVLGDIYTSWEPLTFTLETGTDAAPVVTNLALQTVTVPNASTPTSSESSITGLVLNDGNVSYMTVEIDTTDQGQADDQVTTDANGNFLYQPQNLMPGTYTYQFRAVENAYPDGQIVGQWEPFTFTIVAPNAPVVDTLQLADITGPGTNTTTDPTLTGHVTADGNPQQVTVDFQYNNDGVVDASVTANADGTFTFKPAGLPVGSNTIQVRAVNVDDNIIGDWTSITFTLAAPTAPTVNTLTLLNVTGGTGSNITDDPTVTGTLTAGVGVGVGSVTVQFDTTGDGLPNGSTTTDDNGNFTWTPTGVNPGTVTITARAVATDPSTGSGLIGAWKSITFTYSTGAGPTVSSLSLAHPTGTDSNTGLQTAIDATLSGTLTDGSELAAFLTVQYEINGDTQPDGSTTTDAQGNFTFAPSGLAVGTDTIQVRGVTQDPQTGQEVDGAWKSITFELQQNPLSQPPVLPADADPVATADELVATSLAASQQAVDTGIQSFNSAMGAGSTPSGQISVGIGTYNALSGVVGGRVVSGSIYSVENGSLPAPAGVGTGGSGGSGGGSGGSGGTSGPSLSSSSPVGLPSGTPLNVSNLATPQAGSGTITNQAIAQSGTLGPGNSDVTGTLNGSWTITVTPDPNHSNVTDWTVTVNLSEAYANNLSGSYADTAGTASINHAYADDVPGSYTFTFQAAGTTTTIAGGPTIVAGTYTLVEGNSYSYSFSDSPVTTQTISGADSTSNETVTSGGSHSFEHIETGGSFSTGGGLPSSANGSYSGPAASSTFVDNEIETSSFNDGTAESYNNGSADGGDVGGSSSNDSFTYARNDYQTGTYTGAGGTLTEDVSFNDDTRESDTSTETQTDNFNSSAADGQINGGSQVTTTATATEDDSESGDWSTGASGYTMSGNFDDQQSYQDSDQINESGSESENSDGVAFSDSFSFGETDSADQTDGEQGTDGASGTNFNASGSFSDNADANDQATYTDGGGYTGTVQPSYVPTTSGAGTSSPGAETVNGTYADSSSQTDTGSESDSGTFSDDNEDTSDQGSENDNGSTSLSYTSSGSDSETDPSGSYGDQWSDSGNGTGNAGDSGTFSDSPTLDSASGSLSVNATASQTGSENDQGESTSPSTSLNWSASISGTDTATFQDNGTYTDSEDPSDGASNDEVSGTDGGGDTKTEGDNWSENGTISGSNSYHFNEGGNDTGTAAYNENDSFDDTDSSATGESDSLSGTFSDNDNGSSSGYYNDSGVSSGPSATFHYTDNDNGSDTNTYNDSGTVDDTTTPQQGETDQTDATFNDSDNNEEDDSGTANGTYTQAGRSGQFNLTGSDDTDTSTSDTGSYDNGTTDTESDNSTESDSSKDKFNETDSGTFTGGQSGSYSDSQTDDDTTTDSLSGSTTTTPTGTSTTGTYTDDTNNIDTAGANVNQQQGSQALSSAVFASSSLTYHDNGSYTASGSNPSYGGSFNSTLTLLTVENVAGSGGANGGTRSASAADSTLSTDAANGGETSASGTLTQTGTATDDVLEKDNATENETYPESGGTHSDSGTENDNDHGHADGSFTEANGAITAENMNTTDDDTSTSTGQESDSTNTQAGPGTVVATSDTKNATQSVSYHDSGTTDVSSAGTTVTQSSNSTIHDTDDLNDTTTITFNNAAGNGTATQTEDDTDTTDYVATSSYTMAPGIDNSSSGYNEHDVGTDTTGSTESATAAGDAGTSWSSNANSTVNYDDATNNSVSSGASSGASSNYTDIIKTQDNSSYHETSDQGGAAAPGGGGWSSIPWLILTRIGPSFDFEVPAGGGGGSTPTSTSPTWSSSASSSADSASNDNSTDILTGSSSSQNGTTTSDQSFNDTDNYSDSADQSSTINSSFTDSTGDSTAQTTILTDSSSDSGTETSNGSTDDGVTSDSYNEHGNSTADRSASTTFSNSGPSSSEDETSTTDAHQTTTFTESGDYSTEPPGTMPTKTQDNPNGDATWDQTINSQTTTTNQMNITEHDSESGPSYGANGHGDYAASATDTSDSDSTVSVDVGKGTDTDSGNYSDDESEQESADYNQTGNASNSYLTVNWTGSENDADSQYNDDSGNYGSDGTDTSGNANAEGETLSVTVTTKPSANGTANTTTSTETVAYAYQSPQGSGSDGGKQANQDAQPAAKAQPAAEKQGKTFVFGITGNMIGGDDGGSSSFRSEKTGGLFGHVNTEVGNRMAAQLQEKTGKNLLPAVASKERLKGRNLVDEKVVGWNAQGQDKPTAQVLQGLATKFGMKDATELANAAHADTKPDGLEGFNVRVVLIGYSYGATLASEEAGALQKAISDLGMVPEIHLYIIDGVVSTNHPQPPSGSALTKVPAGLANVVNRYSTLEHQDPRQFPLTFGNGGMGGKIDGAKDELGLAEQHVEMDAKVLLDDTTTQAIADLELKPFVGPPAAP